MKPQKRKMTSTKHNPTISLNWMNNRYTKTQKVLLCNLHYVQIIMVVCHTFWFAKRTPYGDWKKKMMPLNSMLTVLHNRNTKTASDLL